MSVLRVPHSMKLPVKFENIWSIPILEKEKIQVGILIQHNINIQVNSINFNILDYYLYQYCLYQYS